MWRAPADGRELRASGARAGGDGGGGGAVAGLLEGERAAEMAAMMRSWGGDAPEGGALAEAEEEEDSDELGDCESEQDDGVESVIRVRTAARLLAAQLDTLEDDALLQAFCAAICELFGDGIHNEYIQAILEANVVPKIVRILEPLLDGCGGEEEEEDAEEPTSASGARRAERQNSFSSFKATGLVGKLDSLRAAARETRNRHERPRAPGKRAAAAAAASGPRPGRPLSTALQAAALQVIGNIACGDDRQTQVIIDCPNALRILKTLLTSPERSIRKECCWIVSNITESAHQVGDVVDAGILSPIVALLGLNDGACCEDAAWVMYNVTACEDAHFTQELVRCGAVSVLSGHLMSTRELDVAWKGCSMLSAVALRALCNMMNTLPEVVRPQLAAAYGVERLDRLAFAHSYELTDGALQLAASGLLSAHYGVRSWRAQGDTRQPCLLCEMGAQEGVSGGEGAAAVECPHHSREAATTVSVDDAYDGARDTTGAGTRPPVKTTGPTITFPPPLSDVCQAARDAAPAACAFCDGELPPYDAQADDYVGSGRQEHLAALLARAVRLGHQRCLQCLIDRRMEWSDRQVIAEPLIPEGGFGSVAPWEETASPTTRQRLPGVRDVPEPALSGKDDAVSAAGSTAEATLAPATRQAAGAWPSPPCKSVLMLAAELGRASCLVTLLGRLRPVLGESAGHRHRVSLMAVAAYKGHTAAVQVLLQYGELGNGDGADVNHLDASACVQRQCETCGEGLSVLHLAAAGGNADVCALLVRQCGMDVNAVDGKEQRPLSFAACYGWSDTCRVLLELGADVAAADCRGMTALHLACFYGYDNVVRVLLEHARHADAAADAAADRDGEDEEDGGVEDNGGRRAPPHPRLLHRLVNARSSGNTTPVHYAIQGRAVHCVSLLLAAGCEVRDPDPQTGMRNPLLVLAAEAGNLDIVQRLLQSRAPVNCTASIKVVIARDRGSALDEHGRTDTIELVDQFTPLHIAAWKGNLQLAELLLQQQQQQHGAEVNRRSPNGWSALDFAVLGGHEQLTRLLLSRGAVVDRAPKPLPTSATAAAVGDGGTTTARTLVQHAAIMQNKEIVRLLVERLRHQEDDEHGEAFEDAVGRPEPSATTTTTTTTTTSSDTASADVGDAAAEAPLRFGTPPDGSDGPALEPPGGGLASAASSPRKRKETDREQQRQRDAQRREAEATEARERLLEAINARSVPRLCEAISHGNKVVLQLAAGYVKSSAPRLTDSEVSLSAEVERARRVLSALQSQQLRAAADREREAHEARRRAVQQQLQEAIETFCGAGDPKVFDKALRKAGKVDVDESDATLQRIRDLRALLAELQNKVRALEASMKRVQGREPERAHAEEIRAHVAACEAAIAALVSAGASADAFQPIVRARETLTVADSTAAEIGEQCAVLERRRADEQATAVELRASIVALEASLREHGQASGRADCLARVERALEETARQVCAQLTIAELRADCETLLETVRRAFAKAVRAERKRLRQACAQGDAADIEAAMAAAQALQVRALEADIQSAAATRDRLREQTAALAEWSALQARREALTTAELHALREQLEKLGLVEEAEQARLLGEQLAREDRTRHLLEAAIDEAVKARERSGAEAADGGDGAADFVRFGDAEMALCKRLRDLTERARRFEALADRVQRAEDELRQLAHFAECALRAAMPTTAGAEDEGAAAAVAAASEPVWEEAAATTTTATTTAPESRAERALAQAAQQRVTAQIDQLQRDLEQLRTAAARYGECFGASTAAPKTTDRATSATTPSALLAAAGTRIDELVERKARLEERYRELERQRQDMAAMEHMAHRGSSGSDAAADAEGSHHRRELSDAGRSGRADGAHQAANGDHQAAAVATATSSSSSPHRAVGSTATATKTATATPSAPSPERRRRTPTDANRASASKPAEAAAAAAKPKPEGRKKGSERTTTAAATAKRGHAKGAASTADASLDVKHAGTAAAAGTPAATPTKKAPDEPEATLASDMRTVTTDTDSSCAHYYVWCRGNVVYCGKCGDIRISRNQNWLERVKRRTQRRKERLTDGQLSAVEEYLANRKKKGSNQQQTGAAAMAPATTSAAAAGRPGEHEAVHRAASDETMAPSGRRTHSREPDMRAAGQPFYPSQREPEGSLWGQRAPQPTGAYAMPTPLRSGPGMAFAAVGDVPAAGVPGLEPSTPGRTASPFVDATPSPGSVSGGERPGSTHLSLGGRLGIPAAAAGVPNVPNVPLAFAHAAGAFAPPPQPQPTLPLNALASSSSVPQTNAMLAGSRLGTPFDGGRPFAPERAPGVPPLAMSGGLGDGGSGKGPSGPPLGVAAGDAFLFGAPSALARSPAAAAAAGPPPPAPEAFQDVDFANENFGFDIDAIVDEPRSHNSTRRGDGDDGHGRPSRASRQRSNSTTTHARRHSHYSIF